MKILVISDSHGNQRGLEKVIADHPDIHQIIFLGDGEREALAVKKELPPQKAMIIMRGNNDWDYNLPQTSSVFLEGKKFFLTHGHHHHVKHDLLTLEYAAREEDAVAVLFGHTHSPCIHCENGIFMMNPGALQFSFVSSPTYGIVEITKDGITGKICSLDLEL